MPWKVTVVATSFAAALARTTPHPRHDRHKELLKSRGPFDPQALDAKLTTDEMRKLK